MTSPALPICVVEDADGPLRRQRVDACGEIGVDSIGLKHLHQSGSAKIRLPRCSTDVFDAVLMNTAGGLTGGDHLRWQARCATDAKMVLSTAASEKLYRSHGPAARQDSSLNVGRDGLLAWLPQETIVFDGSALERRMEVDLEPGARLLLCESFVYGRAAMGEKLGNIRLRDDWRIRRHGQLLHAEAFRFDGCWIQVAPRAGILHKYGASATVLYCAQWNEEALVQRASASRAVIKGCEYAAISVLPGRVVARLLARTGLELRQMLIPLLAVLEPEIALPRVWNV